MKKFTAIALTVFLALSALGRADLVIIQRVEGAGQNGDMVLKQKGNKLRTDVSPEISTISDLETGTVITLMHGQRMSMTLSAESLRQLVGNAVPQPKGTGNAQPSAGSPADATFKATGAKKAINGIDTEQYTGMLGTMKVTYWVAKDFPDGERITNLYKQIFNSTLGQMVQMMTPQAADMPGVPVQTVVDISPSQKFTVTILSVQEQPVNASEMEVPKDYTALPTPDFSNR